MADFKLTIAKARKQAHHELLRNTPGSPSAELFIAATVARHGNLLASGSTNARSSVLAFLG